MINKLAILGSGELGRQYRHHATINNLVKDVLFYDDFYTGPHIQGKSTDLLNDYSEKKFDAMLIAIGYNHLQKKSELYQMFENKIPFATLIHPTAYIDATAVIAPGTVIYPNCTIDKNVVIGPNTLINLNCTIAHDTTIGSNNFLAPDVAIAGFCKIGNKCFIGINATIIDNTIINDMVRIGAGSVVISHLTESGTYVGNPAKKIK